MQGTLSNLSKCPITEVNPARFSYNIIVKMQYIVILQLSVIPCVCESGRSPEAI